ncbi:MAG: menaquinone biosynthesis decarboxylase [Bacillota bacterium]|nr:menaquinone biosynthesis decarboxylase [Bacillota bacterium]
MAYRNIRHFINALDKKGLLKRISCEVDPELEITEITDRVSKAFGPALLFEKVKGSDFPVLINTFGTFERMSMALGVQKLDDVSSRITELLDISNYITLADKIKSVPQLASLISVFPIKVSHGACQEVSEEPDLSKLPILKCWPEDGGRFITLPLVFTKDPETGAQNVGMYRLQVYDNKTTGMHWHLHKDGRAIYEKYRRIGGRMPVSVAIGCDPATIYAATAPLPSMIDEMMFAGFLRKAPVLMTKCLTNDIFVPAQSEFVLEGYVDANELKEEGPFGDHTGYYSEKDMYPVFHLTKITRKKNPIYMATVVGKPPMEDCYLGKATERIFLPLLRLTAPEIVDMSFPLEGVFHGCVIVSIDKRYPAHAKKIMNTLWGTGQMMYTKMIIVVDKDINPHDYSTVAWKVFNNIDAKRDMVISEGPLDALDHASPMRFVGNRLGIDATKKWPSEGYMRDWPDDIEMSEGIKRQVDKRWTSYGI